MKRAGTFNLIGEFLYRRLPFYWNKTGYKYNYLFCEKEYLFNHCCFTFSRIWVLPRNCLPKLLNCFWKWELGPVVVVLFEKRTKKYFASSFYPNSSG